MKKIITVYNFETIRNTLRKITESGLKCVPVVSKQNKLLGTISDGDIRRAILKKIKLSTKITKFFNQKPFFLNENKISEKKLKELFLKKKLDIIPIINEDKKLIKVINIKDLFSEKKISYKLNDVTPVIMAGGMGTRLKPFTNILPKPLMPVKNKTAIENIIDYFSNFGLNKIYLSINEKSEIIKAFFHELGMQNIQFVEEQKPLGTIGSLSLIKQSSIKNYILISNCDIISSFNINELYYFHKDNKFDITIVVSNKNYNIPYGVCKVFKNGILDKIDEKPSMDFLINIGIYFFSKKIINIIPKDKKINVDQVIRIAKSKNYKVGVFPVKDNEWFDIGQWSEFKKLGL